MGEVVIAAALRTPAAASDGARANATPAPGAGVLRALIERAAIGTDAVDELLLGGRVTSVRDEAPARRAALAAGLAPTTPATTLGGDAVAGLDAMLLAGQIVRAGDARLVIAGGWADADAEVAAGDDAENADDEVVPRARDASGPGVAVVLLCSAARAAELRLPVLARVVAGARVGEDAAAGATVAAARACLARAGWRPETLDLVATAERRALEALGLDPARIGDDGDGPPLAAGAAASVRLVHALRRQDLGRGLVALAGAGRGVALAVEHDTSDSLADVIAPDFGHGDGESEPGPADPPATASGSAAKAGERATKGGRGR